MRCPGCFQRVEVDLITSLNIIQGNGAEEEAEESYVAVAGYCGEHPEDVSFTEGAIVTVLEKSAAGWWVIRCVG